MKQSKENKSARHLPNGPVRTRPAEDTFPAALALVEIINGQRRFLVEFCSTDSSHKKDGIARAFLAIPFVYLFFFLIPTKTTKLKATIPTAQTARTP